MDTDNSKRVPNFTPIEKDFLINLVVKYSNILEDKKTNKVSIQEKNHVWDQIEVEFNNNAQIACFRSSHQLKRLYENKKKELRRKMANNKKETFLTGGGTSQVVKLDSNEEALLQIVNEKTVKGFDVPFDSDSANCGTLYSREFEFSPKASTSTASSFLEKNKRWEEAAAAGNESQSEKRKRQEETEFEFSPVPSEKQPIMEIPLENGINKEANAKKQITSQYQRCPPKIINASISSELTTPSSSVNCSRRRPTTKIKTLTSSDVSEKYNTLLDRRLVLVEKQIEQISEQNNFAREENKQKLIVVNLEKEEKKLKIELLKLELASKRSS